MSVCVCVCVCVVLCVVLCYFVLCCVVCAYSQTTKFAVLFVEMYVNVVFVLRCLQVQRI